MKVINIKLPFGILENRSLLHISQVQSGKKCKCFCPSCNAPLIAAKGNINQHHFKHALDTVCETGLESAIHLAAKKIIIERKRITLPIHVAIESSIDSRGKEHTSGEIFLPEVTTIKLDNVQAEHILHGMKADLLAIIGAQQLIIEILYRHKVDDQKIFKIKQANISAIEINLSDLTPEDVRDWESFWSCINDPKRVKWLHNAKAYKLLHQQLANQLIRKIQLQEELYKEEDIIKQAQEKSEKDQLLQALKDLKILRGEQHTAQLNIDAETHSWEFNKKIFKVPLNQLANFFDLEVPDGGWIFGCDSRMWQTTIFNFFIRGKFGYSSFSIKKAEILLKNSVFCEIPPLVEIITKYGPCYPELVPIDVYNNMPSAWKTLQAFLNLLCEIGMIELSSNNSRSLGNVKYSTIGFGSRPLKFTSV